MFLSKFTSFFFSWFGTSISWEIIVTFMNYQSDDLSRIKFFLTTKNSCVFSKFNRILIKLISKTKNVQISQFKKHGNRLIKEKWYLLAFKPINLSLIRTFKDFDLIRISISSLISTLWSKFNNLLLFEHLYAFTTNVHSLFKILDHILVIISLSGQYSCGYGMKREWTSSTG